MNFKSAILLLLTIVFLSSCNDKTRTGNRPEKITEPAAEETVAAQPESSDDYFFKGIGTEPFWSITINDDSILLDFMNEEPEDMRIPLPEPEESGNTIRYLSETTSKIIAVTLTEENCSDSMSDLTYSHKVEIEIKNKRDSEIISFRGCGNYVSR